MAWQDNLRDASFRGVRFLSESHGAIVGRRRARHVYPRRDLPFHEDMGRRPRAFTVEAYVIGDDYMDRREALTAACEEEGAGTLIHHWLGQAEVICSACRLRETKSEGRMARFTLTFEEAGALLFPSVQADTQAIVERDADQALIGVQETFEAEFSVEAVQNFVVEAARDLVGDTVDDIVAGAGRLRTGADGLAGFLADAEDMRRQLSSLVNTPLRLAERMSRLVIGLLDSVQAPNVAIPFLRRLTDFGDDLMPVPQTTFSRRRQANNQGAIVDLVRGAATVESARAGARVDFVSFDDAVAYRDELTELFDREILAAGNAGRDRTYRDLQRLQASSIQDLDSRGRGLPRVREIVPLRTEPSLVMAYRYYGDDTANVPGRADEIVGRNRVRHPGFVPGGLPLRILTS